MRMIDERQKGIDDLIQLAFVAVAVIALIVIRGALFYYESFDYIHSLSRWTAQFREMTFIEGLSADVGNYNPLYMYILNIIARINIPDLYLIKVVSVFFDIVIAFFAMKLVSLKTSSVNMQILAFLLAFAIPTVILNGAMWGQCDSIYTAFVLGSIYFALSGKGKLAYAFIGIALAFKLQAAFMFPLFAVFVFTKKIRFRDCYFFLIAYLATLIPAMLAGRPIMETLMVYFNQTGTYLHLNMNAVNIWRFFVNVEFEPFRTVGLFVGGVAVLGLLYFTYVNRVRLTETKDFIRLAYLFAVIVPFLLPQMHDRFFFMADVLSVSVFLFDKRRWYVPLVTVFCSFLTYAWLIMGFETLIDYRWAALALTAVIFIVLRDYVVSLMPPNEDSKQNM